MNADRSVRLWSLVTAYAGGGSVGVEHVCTAVIEAAGVDSAAVTVRLSATPRETTYASDRTATDLEELALTLGEGPGVDGLDGGPVLVDDLAGPDWRLRWPVFGPAAVEFGVRAVFALPLRVGAIRLGVLCLYRAEPGSLDREQLADALLLADTTCALLLDAADQEQHPRSPGRGLEHAVTRHAEVHQATGMIIAQLGVTAAVALVRLRAYAYSNGRRLRDVAGDVVARRLRFDPDHIGEDHDGG